MPDDMFKLAVEALKQGQRMRARDLLTRLLKVDQSNADYWLWMSAAVDSEKEQVFCLQNALKIDPNSVAARRGLVVLGALSPEDANLPPGLTLEEPAPVLAAARGLVAERRNQQWIVIGGVLLLALAVIIFAVLARSGAFRPRRTVVVTSTPPPSATPAPTAVVPTATPAICEIPARPNPATPLASYLCLTQTPAPAATKPPGIREEEFNSLHQSFVRAEWSDVIANFDAAVAYPEVSGLPYAYFYVAEAYRNTRQFDEAVAHYSAAIEVDASFAAAYRGRALALAALRRHAEALASFDQALSADPRFVQAYLERGLYQELSGNAAASLADFEQAETLSPGNARALAGLALAQVDSGRARDGLTSAGAALRADPGLALGYFARGKAEYALADYAAADADLTLAAPYLLGEDPPWRERFQAMVLYHAGLARTGTGDEAAALRLFSDGLARDPEYAPLYLARGQLQLRARDFEAARVDLAEAETRLLGPDPGAGAVSASLLQAQLGLGQAHLALGQPDRAVLYFEAVVRADPGDFAATLGLGQAQLQLGRNTAAIEALTAALQIAGSAGEEVQALAARAAAFAAAGTAAEEIADLQAILTAAPRTDPYVQTAVVRLTTMPTATPSSTLSPTPTARPSSTPTPTRTSTPTRRPAATPTATRAATATRTPVVTRTPTRTP